MSDFGNFRTPLPENLIGGNNLIRTPYGNVPSSSTMGLPTQQPQVPPPLPNSLGTNSMMNYGFNGYNSMGSNYFSSPFSSYGMGGMMGMGGGGGYGSYGNYGVYNRFGNMGMMNSPENMFIQMAEERTRPAFQSIESLVAAISNIATMLDSTFFAITNTFRAILGVAANFGRIRGVFAQFWQTFAIFRGLNWVYRKILYWLRVSKIDPSSADFQRAFAAAANGESTSEIKRKSGGSSAWPIITFLGFIFTAPYLIMRLMGTVQKSAQDESRNPKTWINPIPAKVEYNFNARNESELSIRSGQTVLVAPREIQQTHNLLNSGWALATVNRENSGIIPINYIAQLKPNIPANAEPEGAVNLEPTTSVPGTTSEA